MTERVDPFGWRTALVCALLWGVAVSIADVLTEPVDTLPPVALLNFMLGRLWEWIPCGVVWVFGTELIGRGRWGAARAIALLPVAQIVSTAALLTYPLESFRAGHFDNAMGSLPALDIMVFELWGNMFFGGLYVLGYLATRRATRFRRRLAKLRLAQSEADTLLREARVDAYRGQLQPQMLLNALLVLRRRYGEDRAAGDRLFDLLIGFLRAAMPSVRSGFSTLAAELETVRSYALLRDALGGNGARWTLDLPDAGAPLPFPSLILLPAIDELASSLPPEAELRLTVAHNPQGATLRIEADRPASLPEVLDRRLRGGLALTFGSAASVSPDPVLPVEITLRAQALGDRSDAYPHHEGTGDETIPRDQRGHPVDAGGDR